MHRLVLDQDIRPLSEFRSNATAFLKQVHDTKRPLVITQHGKGVAVLLDVREFEAMQAKIELLEEIYQAETQLAAGLGVEHAVAKSAVLESLGLPFDRTQGK